MDNGLSLGKEKLERQINWKKDDENIFDSQNVLIKLASYVNWLIKQILQLRASQHVLYNDTQLLQSSSTLL